MDIEDARVLAEGLLREHGLTGWSLVFDRARTRAGVCRYGRREIGLSAVLTALHEPELVRSTVLHEVAHALVGARHGHDSVWRATARAIGSDGERCLSASAPQPPAPWLGTCLHGHEVKRHRRPSRPASCRRCSATFDVAHVLVWTYRGRHVSLSAAYVRELASATRSAEASRPGSSGSLAVGTPVVLAGTGKYAGVVGLIEKRGRTRYHVRTAQGTLTAPFALVRAELAPGAP